MTLQAALTGNKDLAFQALRLDPLCSHLSAEEVTAMGKELMSATASWLPQFYKK
jgi:alpha-galactosidase/6-phospho-beta-glucosidase family protein